ncbi:MAG: FkbM family methyltransferase [Gammaproteobacteria bacterium]|nr:FkbM family methyltransferase [Gammaproteobacteria bacterium]
MTVSDFTLRNLFKVYGLAQRMGLMELNWFRALFLRSYYFYKRTLEDPFRNFRSKRPELLQAGHIFDVGSNVGYTAVTFAQALGPGFKVFSFEPEPQNVRMQKASLELYKVSAKVELIQAAVGAESGSVTLWHNQDHHADHRIVTKEFGKRINSSDETCSVPLISIDTFIEQRKIHGPIAFIKIDVQGYELPVCYGMENALRANPECVVAFEYCPPHMRELGYAQEELLEFFARRGYGLNVLNRQGNLQGCDNKSLAVALDKRGYVDLLATPQAVKIQIAA